MKFIPAHVEFPEPERYELSEAPPYQFELNRREFVQTLGAGLLICVAIPDVLGQRAGSNNASVAERLHIAEDGTITIFTSKVEVGQGSRTQLTQAAAEELTVPAERIRLVMADSAFGPNDGGTAGSRTTPSTVPAIRKGCAAARQMLIEAAAKKFQRDAANLSVENGQIKGLQFSYADLAKDPAALRREAPRDIQLRPVSDWTVLGRTLPKVQSRMVVTGEHKYPSDISRPGMLYGKVLRPPAYNSELVDVDLNAARAPDGVVAVRDGNFAGVAATNSFLAGQALQRLVKTAKWKTGPHPSSDELYAHLKSHVSGGRTRREVKGSPDDLLKDSGAHRSEYHIAYIQHAPMEPRAAVAEWEGAKLTVWTGTQQPQRVHQELCRSFNLAPENVRVIVPDTGGGFGGKHSGEAAVEAARLAKEARKPVNLRWTREEEFTWAYFRPAGVISIAATINEDGAVQAWEQINYNSGGSALATPYDIPNSASEFKPCDAPLRAGSYRALASTANIFARECAMDDLAVAASLDPLEFRLKHLGNERLRAVLIAAAEKFRWKSRWRRHDSAQASGVGLACGTEKGSFAACCVEVEISNGTYRVTQIVNAFECGAIQNPRNLLAQVEGCIIQGLGGALREEMRFKDGKILNARFSQYAVPRFKDIPPLETVLLDRKDLPSVGAGETPIVGIAPAIANALFHATGTRIRSLPIRNSSLKPA